MSWLHSREPGNFQMHKCVKMTFLPIQRLLGLGGFLLKFDSIRKFVTKGA